MTAGSESFLSTVALATFMEQCVPASVDSEAFPICCLCCVIPAESARTCAQHAAGAFAELQTRQTAA